MIKVTKIEAAQRQLDTAIKLWLEDDDPVSIHTLAAASYQIVHDINRQKKGPPLLLDSATIRPEMKQEFVNVVKGLSNYFKHADDRGKKRKAPQSVEIDPSINEPFFVFAIVGLESLGEKLTPYQEAFRDWQAIKRPDLLTDTGMEFVKNRVDAEGLAALQATPKKELFNALIKARQV